MRDCISSPGDLVLTCRWAGQPLHFRLNRVVGQQGGEELLYQFEGACFGSVSELLQHHLEGALPISELSGALIANPVRREATTAAGAEETTVIDMGQQQYGSLGSGAKEGEGETAPSSPSTVDTFGLREEWASTSAEKGALKTPAKKGEGERGGGGGGSRAVQNTYFFGEEAEVEGGKERKGPLKEEVEGGGGGSWSSSSIVRPPLDVWGTAQGQVSTSDPPQPPPPPLPTHPRPQKQSSPSSARSRFSSFKPHLGKKDKSSPRRAPLPPPQSQPRQPQPPPPSSLPPPCPPVPPPKAPQAPLPTTTTAASTSTFDPRHHRSMTLPRRGGGGTSRGEISMSYTCNRSTPPPAALQCNSLPRPAKATSSSSSSSVAGSFFRRFSVHHHHSAPHKPPATLERAPSEPALPLPLPSRNPHQQHQGQQPQQPLSWSSSNIHCAPRPLPPPPVSAAVAGKAQQQQQAKGKGGGSNGKGLLSKKSRSNPPPPPLPARKHSSSIKQDRNKAKVAKPPAADPFPQDIELPSTTLPPPPVAEDPPPKPKNTEDDPDAKGGIDAVGGAYSVPSSTPEGKARPCLSSQQVQGSAAYDQPRVLSRIKAPFRGVPPPPPSRSGETSRVGANGGNGGGGGGGRNNKEVRLSYSARLPSSPVTVVTVSLEPTTTTAAATPVIPAAPPLAAATAVTATAAATPAADCSSEVSNTDTSFLEHRELTPLLSSDNDSNVFDANSLPGDPFPAGLPQHHGGHLQGSNGNGLGGNNNNVEEEQQVGSNNNGTLKRPSRKKQQNGDNGLLHHQQQHPQQQSPSSATSSSSSSYSQNSSFLDSSPPTAAEAKAPVAVNMEEAAAAPAPRPSPSKTPTPLPPPAGKDGSRAMKKKAGGEGGNEEGRGGGTVEGERGRLPHFPGEEGEDGKGAGSSQGKEGEGLIGEDGGKRREKKGEEILPIHLGGTKNDDDDAGGGGGGRDDPPTSPNGGEGSQIDEEEEEEESSVGCGGSVFDMEKFCSSSPSSAFFGGRRDNKPLEASALSSAQEALLCSSPRSLALHLTAADVRMLSLDLEGAGRYPGLPAIRSGLLLLTLVDGRALREDIMERFLCLRLFVLVTILGATR